MAAIYGSSPFMRTLSYSENQKWPGVYHNENHSINVRLTCRFISRLSSILISLENDLPVRSRKRIDKLISEPRFFLIYQRKFPTGAGNITEPFGYDWRCELGHICRFYERHFTFCAVLASIDCSCITVSYYVFVRSILWWKKHSLYIISNCVFI